MDPIVVEARRNGIVEARHVVHAVAVRDGAVVAEAGDAGLTCFLRSSSKPIQALPLARARDDLDDRDLAIASASHRATPDQIAAVRALLAKAPADEADLDLRRAAPGWFAKGGAEGLLCAAGPGSLGVALKSIDGASRPLGPALAAFLGALGVDLPGRAGTPIENTRGEIVGELIVTGS